MPTSWGDYRQWQDAQTLAYAPLLDGAVGDVRATRGVPHHAQQAVARALREAAER